MIAILFAIAGLVTAGLLRGRAALAESTLTAPWAWMLTTVAGLAGSEVVIAINANGSEPVWSEPLRYAATMLTFAPGMAVLGAKRPQDRGWQWVVLTLWVVLSLPAIQAALYGMGARVPSFLAWKLLIAVLLMLEVLNYIVSRYRWAAWSFVAAQLVLLWPHMIAGATTGPGYAALALGLIAVGMLLCVATSTIKRSNIDACTATWKRFVDEYGSMWAFRVMALINQSADAAHWPVRVMPFGFVDADSGAGVTTTDLPSEVQYEARLALRNTLRRFYSAPALAELDMPRQ